jgi:hypothetical protein
MTTGRHRAPPGGPSLSRVERQCPGFKFQPWTAETLATQGLVRVSRVSRVKLIEREKRRTELCNRYNQTRPGICVCTDMLKKTLATLATLDSRCGTSTSSISNPGQKGPLSRVEPWTGAGHARRTCCRMFPHHNQQLTRPSRRAGSLHGLHPVQTVHAPIRTSRPAANT